MIAGQEKCIYQSLLRPKQRKAKHLQPATSLHCIAGRSSRVAGKFKNFVDGILLDWYVDMTSMRLRAIFGDPVILDGPRKIHNGSFTEFTKPH